MNSPSLDPYALLFNENISAADQHQLLKNVRYPKGGYTNRRGEKQLGFIDFCAALRRTTLPIADKKWFYDLFFRLNNIEQLPALDFPQFLRALNINFPPLREVLERKLIRDVMIQHLLETAIFQTPALFDKTPYLEKGSCLFLAGKMILPKSKIKEIAKSLGLKVQYQFSDKVTHVVLGEHAENWINESNATNFQVITERALQAYFNKKAPKYLQEAEQSGEVSMVNNVIELLESGDNQNIVLALELLKGGGVPKMVLQYLLILTKADEIPEIRKTAKKLLLPHAPPQWNSLIKNRLRFYHENVWASIDSICKQVEKLGQQIEPEMAAFFTVLLQGQLDIYPEMRDALDEPLYEFSKRMAIEKNLLQADSVVFVNGTTRLTKTEIKAKLEAANLKYTQNYSKEVTHVLIGSNPKTWDLDNANFKILTENHLQTYLSSINPAYLEQEPKEGDSQMTDNLLALLHSHDEANVTIALEMLDGGGVPTDLIVPALVVNKTTSDAKIRAKSRKLLELYAPADWLPLLKNKLLFKGITGNAKENDLNKKLDKLAKETSLEVAAILSMGMYQKFGQGLRFMMKKSNKKIYLEAAKLLLDGTHFEFAKGLGYKNWRNHAPEAAILVTAWKMAVNLPVSILKLGKIESIDFHNCKFKEMPKNITKFVDLKELDFSHNFIAELPLDIAKLKNLEVLDLKMNQFEEFPIQLATLKNLKKVDLRFNGIHHQFTKLDIPQTVKDALPNCEILV